MGDIVNMNRFRKAQARADRDAQAATNRARFGRTKASRRADRSEVERRDTLLDHARRDPRDDEPHS
jgi:hypothetical protein